jgi:hypothetical protein
MTIAEFYRHEAERCQRRSAQSDNTERAEKWFALARGIPAACAAILCGRATAQRELAFGRQIARGSIAGVMPRPAYIPPELGPLELYQ